MVVRTNAMGINANNNLYKNNSSVSKNLEKLSSGFRINRAADDASGLAISEKMKAQIKALDTASANAQDGISLIQTAEGYMGEVHDMLNRMVELAEKSANGTYETVEGGAEAETYANAATDRKALQAEMDQLSAEIDRIAETANFNNNKIMNGDLAKKFTDEDIDGLKMLSDTATAAEFTGDTVAAGEAGDYYKADGTKVTLAEDDAAPTETLFKADQFVDATVDAANAGKKLFNADMTAANVEGSTGGLKLQIGETSAAADKLVVSVRDFRTAQLFSGLSDAGLTETNNDSVAAGALTVNISNQDKASESVSALRDVINTVSAQRADLGAMQNRLEYTINNLNTASENMSSANSRIRDTDMAKTMMQYTQGNVLTQAAQAMLAQANQQPQGVLQLLQ
ncbi:MAG: flagellin [Oscillospiraceae bacterium]|nr:flagellin [Oscillospiraceae bacterium]MBQ8378625.1 flagellin [Oscillospiraceae bacterium]